MVIVPLLLLTFVVAILSSSAMGGLNFSWKAAAPKASKLNPLTGLKRMFGLRSVIELVKSIMKFCLVAAVLAYMVYDFADELLVLSAMSFEPAMEAAGHMVGLTSVLVTITLVSDCHD